jgi:hypothetical protein
LQRVSGAFAAHALPREPPQFLVDERHQFFERGLVAATPLKQQLGDVSGHAERWTLQFGRELRLIKQDETLRRAPQFITSLDLVQ